MDEKQLSWFAPLDLYWKCPICGSHTYERLGAGRSFFSSPEINVPLERTSDAKELIQLKCQCNQAWHLTVHQDGKVVYHAEGQQPVPPYVGTYMAADPETGNWLTSEMKAE